MTRPWIKQPVSRLNDARLHFVSVQAQRDYFMMYMLAGQLDAEGSFVENGRKLTDKEIAFRINTKPSTLKKSINELKRERLLHINGKGPEIIDWVNEQINWRDKQEADRERQARHRDVTRDSDSVTRDGDDVTRLDKIKTRPEEDKKKTRPTPTPSTTAKGKSSPSGRKAGDKVKDESLSFDKLTNKQRARAEHAQKILASLGIRNPKLKTTSIILATRHFKTTEQMTIELLAAIASVYADVNVKSKEGVIIHRLESNSVPRSFVEDKKLWRSIPRNTLAISGIDVDDHYDQLYKKLHQRGKESND